VWCYCSLYGYYGSTSNLSFYHLFEVPEGNQVQGVAVLTLSCLLRFELTENFREHPGVLHLKAD